MKTIEEKLDIYRAYLNGAQIQWKPYYSPDNWEDILTPSFNYEESDYRVKPEPQKQKVAYAFVGPSGFISWVLDVRKIDQSIKKDFLVRASEFDIIANEKK